MNMNMKSTKFNAGKMSTGMALLCGAGAVAAVFIFFRRRRKRDLDRRFTGMGVAPVVSASEAKEKLKPHWQEGQHDIVDEASSESFPASDPPAR
ncbi:MAG: hypothetical protein AB7P49_06350 [Bdellovibrionales bacterium]